MSELAPILHLVSNVKSTVERLLKGVLSQGQAQGSVPTDNLKSVIDQVLGELNKLHEDVNAKVKK